MRGMHFGKRKSVGIIGSVGVPAKYGGFETLTEYLVRLLGSELELHVGCSKKAYEEHLTSYYGARLHYVPLSANGIQSIPYDIWSLLKLHKHCDTLLILGVASGFFLPIYRLFSKKRIVLNVDGLEWKREKWGKLARWYLRNAEKFAVKASDIVVADNKVIQDHLWRTYGVKSELIEYGADHAHKQAITEQTSKRFPFIIKPYAFKVCRIEPENNVEMILDAFHDQQELDLVLVGNWNASEYGQALRKKFQCMHFHLLDPIYDQTILDQLRSNCKVYVHGHSAGGTNPSLVEAMFLGLPILAFDVEYNRETTANQALGYFQDTEQLSKLIVGLEKHTLAASGKEMNGIAQHRYTWKIITEKYKSVF